MARTTLLDEILDLAELLKPAWAPITDRIPAWHPRNEGDDDADGDGDGSGDDSDDRDGAGGDDGDDGDGSREPDWKSESRKHERRAKQERRAREEAERKLAERDQADQTDQEKAIQAAREEGEKTAREEGARERRADRLEVATTRLAARGVTIDDKVVKFADPEDAMVHIERAIRNGDVDEDDIFDDNGKVQTDALQTALGELLKRKPHLQASGNGARPSGDADAGRGSGTRDPDELSVEDHLKHIQTRR